MTIEGVYTLPVARERLWELLMDPDVLAAAMPGCEHLQRTGEDSYEGVVTAKLGSIQSTYTTRFTVVDPAYPSRYGLRIEGQGPGGFVQGDVRIELVPEGDHDTRMHHRGEAKVGGKLARVGQRVVQAGAKIMIDRGFEALHARIEREADRDAEREPEQVPGGLRQALVASWYALIRFVRRVRERFRRAPDG